MFDIFDKGYSMKNLFIIQFHMYYSHYLTFVAFRLDINQIIGHLSRYLINGQRSLVLRSLGISHEKILSAPKQGQSLKEETTTILDNWYKDQTFKYWKCQELFTVFRNRGELSSIKIITDKFTISGMSNISNMLIVKYTSGDHTRIINVTKLC